MPSDKEIQESGVSVYGTVHLNDPCKLGEIAVVKFYDHVDAIAAAGEQGYMNGRLDYDSYDVALVYEQGQRDALAAAVQRVEALHIDGAVWLLRHEVIAAIKGEQE